MKAGERAARAHAYENPRPEVQALVPRDARRVLDLGCASGALGGALKARQPVEVVGVEVDPDYARDAAGRLDRVIEADVEELAGRDGLAAELGRFDCLIAADVLEHLVDPWRTLRVFAALIEPGRHAVVSLPNVRYWETFWQLGRHGVWPRRCEGIFDQTHLRWFTLTDAIALLRGAGLEPDRVSRQIRLLPQGSRFDRHARRLERVRFVRPFFTFQYVVAARKR